MILAPIVLFAYNRPKHLRLTLESLSQNDFANQSDLILFIDGPKEGASEGVINDINEVKKIASEKKWCKTVTIIAAKTNKGLAVSVIDGVAEVLAKYDKLIVLEDDLVTSKYFLSYMNQALDMYEDKKEVACISGYIYPVKGKLPETFFIKGADCWGWATWKRAWNVFEKDGAALLNQIESKGLSKTFDFEDSYPYLQMLKDQIEKKNSSWAIRWYASTFINNMFCLYPGVSLVQNIGIDGSGTHSGTSNNWLVKLAIDKINVLPIKIEEDIIAKNRITNYFRRLKKRPSILKKIIKELIAKK
jgi:glycosyltransferase involved in cell wall biosynthesis